MTLTLLQRARRDAITSYETVFPKLTDDERASFIDGFNDGWSAKERALQEAAND